MEQRSEEWFAARKGRVTGSSVGAILGLDPWRTRDDVMRAMVREWHNAPREFEGNAATRWGVANEANAIGEFEMETGLIVGKCGFYQYGDWLGASPDGLVSDGGLIEVKCPYGLRDQKEPQFKTVDEQQHYYAQMQIEMLCTDREFVHFVQWSPFRFKRDVVEFDPEWIHENLPILRQFHDEYRHEREHNYKRHLEPLRRTVDTPRALQMVAEWDDLCDAIERAEERKKELLASIVEQCKGQNAVFGGRNLTLVKKDGAVSYSKVVKDLLPDADLEKYRGKPSEYWVLK